MRFVKAYLDAALGSLRRGVDVAWRWSSLALVLAGALLLGAAYLARPSLVIDLGSGRETTLVEGFASFDAEGGTNFRRALPGAALNLRDFGGGSEWSVAITASLAEGDAREIVLARAGEEPVNAVIDRTWTTTTVAARAPLGWRSGLRVELPQASRSLPLRIDRVEIDRGRSLPSLAIVVAVTGAALLLIVACGASGLGWRASLVAGVALLVAQVLAVFADPVLSIPFAPSFAGIVALGVLFAASLAAVLALLQGRDLVIENGSAVVVIVAIGFTVWLSAMSFPLYRGLHFVYHSNIAEEIWKGNFLTFYLPNPDNILSREAQWGGLVVPYPCLYHTIVAPLAALPSRWFHFLHKVLQAWLLATMAVAAAVLAWRLGGGRAAVLAALVTVSLSATFQLVSLSHFVTVFGCWASSMALGYLVLFIDRLGERAFWWGGVALLTLAFLSYTASLFFTGITLALALPLLFREGRGSARPLFTSTLGAVAASLVLYYMHWIPPFLRESVPMLLGDDDGSAVSVAGRLAAIPGKLDYSFGSFLLPLVGLVGLGVVVRRSSEPWRYVLVAWSAIIVLFSGFDLFFNFILKHHYFVMVPVAVGVAVAADGMIARKAWLRGLAVALLVYFVSLGGRAALATAMGTMG